MFGADRGTCRRSVTLSWFARTTKKGMASISPWARQAAIVCDSQQELPFSNGKDRAATVVEPHRCPPTDGGHHRAPDQHHRKMPLRPDPPQGRSRRTLIENLDRAAKKRKWVARDEQDALVTTMGQVNVLYELVTPVDPMGRLSFLELACAELARFNLIAPDDVSDDKAVMFCRQVLPYLRQSVARAQ